MSKETKHVSELAMFYGWMRSFYADVWEIELISRCWWWYDYTIIHLTSGRKKLVKENILAVRGRIIDVRERTAEGEE